MGTMTIVVQYAIWEYPYKKTTLIQIQLTSLTKKGEENLYGLHSPLQELEKGALAEKGSTKMTKWSVFTFYIKAEWSLYCSC